VGLELTDDEGEVPVVTLSLEHDHRLMRLWIDDNSHHLGLLGRADGRTPGPWRARGAQAHEPHQHGDGKRRRPRPSHGPAPLDGTGLAPPVRRVYPNPRISPAATGQAHRSH